jgi:hypothetical protein
MNLPDPKTGNPILAEDLQRINAAIKQIRLRPGPGYSLRETNGGVTIALPASMIGGGGGAALPCPFQVTDVSDNNGMKVEIAWGLIWNQLPLGMFPDNNPPLRMNLMSSSFVYSKIEFNRNTLLPVGVSFSIETELRQNTDTIQYNLIAVVTVDGQGDDVKISKIENICRQPFPSPCSLAPATA